jgi:hypothetical protein
MVRGKALREELLPLLKRHINEIDAYVRERIMTMIDRYKLEE